jgi:hypothetical protein
LVFLEIFVKLTRRQEEFIANLIDLSEEFEGPIHYSILAERLGVSPFTAYDMLCLLEEKGLVTSEYSLAADKNGPGRTERLFYPRQSIEERKELLAEELEGHTLGKEKQIRFVLDKIQRGRLMNNKLTEEVLVRVPEIEPGEISYCVEIMTIVALRLRSSSGRKLLLDHLPKILPANKTTREDLTLLGGFAFGILAQECLEDDEWVRKLFVHIQQYLSIVLRLNPQECNQLTRALSEVFLRLTDESHSG